MNCSDVTRRDLQPNFVSRLSKFHWEIVLNPAAMAELGTITVCLSAGVPNWSWSAVLQVIEVGSKDQYTLLTCFFTWRAVCNEQKEPFVVRPEAYVIRGSEQKLSSLFWSPVNVAGRFLKLPAESEFPLANVFFLWLRDGSPHSASRFFP